MSEKVGIEINLINADKALETLKNIEASTKRIGARRTKIQMEDGDVFQRKKLRMLLKASSIQT